MGPWIREAKNKTVEMIQDAKKVNPEAEMRVAFVGYRDYGDTIQTDIVDFTTPEEAQSSIQEIEAEGGDDDAEDIATALFEALQLSWSGDVKIVIHITDAPAHGMQFHSASMSDRFPSGDPDGRDPRDSVEKFSFLNMMYTFVKISHDTDKMLEEFEKCYKQGGTFTVLDLHCHTYNGPVDDTEDPMPLSMSREVSRNITASITRYTASLGQ
jgi:hypothetical protein